MTIDDTTVQREPDSLPSPWRSSRFRLFFTARSTSLLADGMLMVSLTTAVLGAGYGAAEWDTRWPRGWRRSCCWCSSAA